jgi:hypothetical protein
MKSRSGRPSRTLVAPSHYGLHGLGRELGELLPEAARDPGYRIGFPIGLAAAVSAGSQLMTTSTHVVGRLRLLRGLAWAHDTLIIRRGCVGVVTQNV